MATVLRPAAPVGVGEAEVGILLGLPVVTVTLADEVGPVLVVVVLE